MDNTVDINGIIDIIQYTNIVTIGDSPLGSTQTINILYKSTLKIFSCSSYVISIGNNAFYGFLILTSINLTTITSIGDGSFYNCKALTTLGSSHSITGNIGENAFFGCKSINQIVLTNDSRNQFSDTNDINF